MSKYSIWLLTLLAGFIVLAPGPVHAQPAAFGASYITPFPENDVYKIRVIGDSLAEGLVGAMSNDMTRDVRIEINRHLWTLNRITTNRFATELKELVTDLENEKVHIAVIMLGMNDRRSVRDAQGNSHRFGTPEWRSEYARRVDRLMKELKGKGIAVYWLGAPSMRSLTADAETQIINEIIRERAYLNGLKYIDTVASFADGQEGYSAYGPDLSGKISLLRWRDGIHFTGRGNEKLAHFLERELKRDLAQAKSDRSIPLAGSEEEQRRLSALGRQDEKANLTGWRAAIDRAKAKAATHSSDGPFFLRAGGGEQREDNSLIRLKTIGPDGRESLVPIEIVRPAIPASVVALVSRKQSPERPTPMGAVLVDQIAGGLNIMSTVTAASDASIDGHRRLSPTQTPFFRVLVKGERLEARAGRADDFSWPRPAPPPVKPAPNAEDETGDGEPMPLPGTSPFRPRA
jgi:hypothetical protein